MEWPALVVCLFDFNITCQKQGNSRRCELFDHLTWNESVSAVILATRTGKPHGVSDSQTPRSVPNTCVVATHNSGEHCSTSNMHEFNTCFKFTTAISPGRIIDTVSRYWPVM